MARYIKKTSKTTGLAPGSLIYTGPNYTHAPVISVISYNKNSYNEANPDRSQSLKSFLSADQVTWININGIHQTDLVKKVGTEFTLHPLLLENILNTHQRPKSDFDEDVIFVTLKMLSWDSQKKQIQSEHISLVLGNNYVLSLQERPGDVFNHVRNRIKDNIGRIRTMKADYLLYALIDAVVDYYFLIMENLGEQIESLETKILKNTSAATLKTLNMLKREMIYIKKCIFPLRETINSLIKTDHKLIHSNTQRYWRDLYDHSLNSFEIIESYRDILNGLRDTFLTSNSNKMNEIMKFLTIFAAIFIPLTFIAGVYGMNFEFMPELHFKFGYFIVLSIMLLTGGGMLLWFKKKKWL